MEKILSEKIKEFKEKENREFEKIKQEYDIKIKSFKDKYKELEEKEFSYLENEYNKTKEKMQAEYSTKISSLENKLKSNHDVLRKEVKFIVYNLDYLHDF
jgi:vacuolar-type H+-ATPase subunit H